MTEKQRAPLAEATGHVPLPPDEVRRRLAARLTGARLEQHGENAVLAIQGGWWYRGEYTVAARDDGTEVTYRVFNIAEHARWAVPLVNHFFVGFADACRAGLARLLAAISDEPR